VTTEPESSNSVALDSHFGGYSVAGDLTVTVQEEAGKFFSGLLNTTYTGGILQFDAVQAIPYALCAMLDALIRRYSSPFLAEPARRIVGLGLGAEALRAAGFVAGIAALPAIGRRAYLLGLALIVLGRLLDMFGGAVARLQAQVRSGPDLEHVVELVWTASVPFVFALAEPERALAAMFLMLGLVARAAVVGAVPDARPPGPPSALDLGARLLGKSEIFIAYALACIFPSWFSVIAYALGVACFVMTGFRVAASEIHKP
jgi:phosphatidylglycerophosphate synthase